MMRFYKTCAVLLLGMATISFPAQSAVKSYFAYVGTYTKNASKGIYGFRYDAISGQYTALGVMAEQPNPSFLATEPTHRFLYASTEIGNGPRNDPESRKGYISAYAIDPDSGSLKLLNRVHTEGNLNAHLAVDHTGKALFAVNYGSGTVVSFRLNPDGSIGARATLVQHSGKSVNPVRQEGPHPHEVVMSPDNRFLFVPDLGQDKIFSYRVDPSAATFTANDPASVSVNAGLGPRHMLFGKAAHFAYVVCEMGSSVVALSYDAARGLLAPIQTISTLPDSFKGEDNSAEIALSPSGRFLYASNRGQDSITVFAIDPEKGTLMKIGNTLTGGKTPRSFVLAPDGRHLAAANQDSDTITLFDVDPKTGLLIATGKSLDVSSPVDILFVPAR